MLWGNLLTSLGEARAWSWGAFGLFTWGFLEGGHPGGKVWRTGVAEFSWETEEDVVIMTTANTFWTWELPRPPVIPMGELHSCPAVEVWAVPVHRWDRGKGRGFTWDLRTCQCSASFTKLLSSEEEMCIFSTSASREPSHSWSLARILESRGPSEVTIALL